MTPIPRCVFLGLAERGGLEDWEEKGLDWNSSLSHSSWVLCGQITSVYA